MPNTTETKETPKAEIEKARAEKVRLDGVFAGQYRQVAWELFRDVQRIMGLSPEQAERVASCLSADIGRQEAISGVEIGKKITKDGMVTVRAVAAKLPKTKLTFTLAILKVCADCNNFGNYGVESVDIELSKATMDWINKV